MAKMTTASRIIKRLGLSGEGIRETLNKKLNDEERTRLANVLVRPDLNIRYSRTSDTISLFTSYGRIAIDGTDPTAVKGVYVNGQEYSLAPSVAGLDALERLTGEFDDVAGALGEPVGRRSVGRQARRTRRQLPDDIPLERIQQTAYDDLSRAGLTYTNLFAELGGVMRNGSPAVSDLMAELTSYDVEEDNIAHFLVYDSEYKTDVLSRMYNYNQGRETPAYQYETVTANEDTFIGRLVGTLGHTEGLYDRAKGVLTLQEDGYTRSITNLPDVDERGVFHNGNVAYLPHYIGYFQDGAGSRVERLRLIDPVETAITGAKLSYTLTKRGDIKFKSILDVTRNLPDFDTHPYGQEILDTLKRKVALASSYHESNSLLSQQGKLKDDLGAVALTMMDADAEGIIDPYGTSNGRNLGMIFYLAKDAIINEDGSLTRGEARFSPVGEILDAQHADRDNFNRNQMSFNAFLTSLDVKKQNAFIGEFAFWNMEDGVVLTNDLGGTVKVGDKLEDFHGNKSTISIILSELTDEQVKERHLEHAVQFAKDNPDVDIIISTSSLASRLNMGIAHEGLDGEQKKDVTLPDGSVVKDGMTQLTYMRLSQTAEHKGKDYAVEGNGRRYSTLLRYALTAKVGDLYQEGIMSEDVRNAHIDEAAATFARLGVSFDDDKKLTTEGNVNLYVDAPVTVHMDEFEHVTPAAIRQSLMKRMEGGSSINIDLGSIKLTSRLYDGPIGDSLGRNVLPIRVPEGGTIPYRYMDLFTQISRGNAEGIREAYQKFSDIDYGALTVKDNILKHIDTMTFRTDARTSVTVPDPSLGLNQVRSNLSDKYIIAHRDPAIQSGNALSMENVGGGAKNVIHTNPLMINMVDGDYDGDTMGENGYKNLNLSDEKKKEFFERSNVTARVNYYGDVNLGTNSSYFKALSKVNGIDNSDLTFADGKSNAEIVRLVEEKTRTILDSPKSYGAYAISFTNEQSVRDTLCKMADDGIKGNRANIERHMSQGYTHEENQQVAKALIAKSEWTGLAGAITNKLISNLGEGNDDILKSAMDITYTMTQSVLQMKHDAEKLPEIDQGIKQMKEILCDENAAWSTEEARTGLKTVTKGLIPERAIDEFVDKVSSKMDPNETRFGHGVICGTPVTSMQLSYASADSFEKAILALGDGKEGGVSL